MKPREVPAPAHLLPAVHASSRASDDWLSAALRRRGIVVGRHGVGRLRRGELVATLGYYCEALHCLTRHEAAAALGLLVQDYGLQVAPLAAPRSGMPRTLRDLQGAMNRSLGGLLIGMSKVVAEGTRRATPDREQLVRTLLELRDQVDLALHMLMGGPPPPPPGLVVAGAGGRR